jgi:IclR family KDG regulon transcriptional repressor
LKEMRDKMPARRSAENGPAGGQAAASPSRTLEKGLLVLNLFDVEHPEWTLKAMREQAGLPKATGFRLVKTLENLGYLAYDPKSGAYHLGSSMLRAAYLTLTHSELARLADPYLRRLTALTTETVSLTVQTDQGAMIVRTEYTSRPFKPHNPPGMFLTTLANVHTRIFVAFGPENMWPDAIAVSREPRTNYTMTDPERLFEELVRVRREGLAFGLQEYILGMCAIGAPVFDSSGEVRACVAVVAPSERFGPREILEYAAAVKEAAAGLSHELGFRETPPS